MFGIEDLRPTIDTDGVTMGCPVRGCATRVPIQRGRFSTATQFRCRIHGICIGKSTFEYLTDEDNLLWISAGDKALLQRAKKVKRESRMQRERSEDALSWNVFRHLETSGRLGPWITSVTGVPSVSLRLHYWSFDATTDQVWTPLAEARDAFGELPNRGSEPDLVITTDDTDIWVEAKFGSNNNTRPTEAEGARVRYTSGGDGWYKQVVKSSFETVAVEHRRYELLRLWLLGSWAARQRRKQFELINLVRHGFEEDVPEFASTHLNLAPSRRVHRVTWESLKHFIENSPDGTPADVKLTRYMREKTLGYDTRGRLVRAFAP